MSTDICLSVRRVKLGDLRTFYGLYTDAIREWRKRQIEIQLDAPYKRTGKWSILHALAMRLIHVLLARLNAVSRTGSISPFFQNQLDPIVLEIFAEDKFIGYCSLVRHSAQVFEIEVIEIMQTETKDFNIRETVKAVKKYVSGLGATRIIVGTGSEKMADLLKNCGFTLAFLDDVLYFDL